MGEGYVVDGVAIMLKTKAGDYYGKWSILNHGGSKLEKSKINRN